MVTEKVPLDHTGGRCLLFMIRWLHNFEKQMSNYWMTTVIKIITFNSKKKAIFDPKLVNSLKSLTVFHFHNFLHSAVFELTA